MLTFIDARSWFKCFSQYTRVWFGIHSYQYSALALGPLLSTHLLKLIRVISKCGFVLVARVRLQLVSVLQLFDPFGFLRFETAHFCFDRLSSVVLFVNPVDQVLSLLLTLYILSCSLALTPSCFWLLIICFMDLFLSSSVFLCIATISSCCYYSYFRRYASW